MAQDGLIDYTIHGPDGNSYTVRAAADATDEELISFVQQSLTTPAQPEEPVPVDEAPIAEQTPAQARTPPPLPEARGEMYGQGGWDAPKENPFRQEALAGADQLTQMLADPKYTNEQIQAFADSVKKQGFEFVQADLDENLALRSQGKPTGAAVLDENNPLFSMFDPKEQDIADGSRNAWDRFADNFVAEGQRYGPGFIARLTHDFLDSGKDELRKIYPGRDDEWYEEMSDYALAQAQRNIITESAQRQAQDPAWKPDQTFLQAALSPEWAIDFAGGALGSMGPEAAINPGGTIARRMGAQAVAGGAANIGYQGANIAAGVQDEFDPLDAAIDAAGGAGVEGLIGLAGKGVRSLRAPAAEPTPPRINGLADGKVSAADRKQRLTEATDQIVGLVNDETADWTNSPSFTVHDSFDKMKGVNKTDLGVYNAETGEVALNTKAILEKARKLSVAPDDIVRAVTFHEGLGHFGLAQRFGDELDDELGRYLASAPDSFKRAVDEWLEAHPDTYKGDPNRDIRAAEEVMANWSNKGQMPATFVDRMLNRIKDLGRAMGWEIRYSERELKTILGMAHGAVTKGKGRDVRGNGFRFASETGGENKVTSVRMADGTTLEILTDAKGEWLDTMNHRGPNGSELPVELKPTVEDITSGRYPVAPPEKRSERTPAYSREETQRLIDENGGKEPQLDFSPSRREQIISASQKLADTRPGETQTIRPFPKDEPDYWWFRHVTQDGRPVTGTYTIEDGRLQDFSISADGGATSIGPKAIRQIGRDLMSQHDGVKGISGYRISGARATQEFVETGNRFMTDADLRSSDLTADELFESQNAYDILDNLTKDYEPEVLSMDDLKHEAEIRGLTAYDLLRSNPKEAGGISRRLMMYDIAADKLNTKITRLYGKIQSGNFTAADQSEYLKTLVRFEELASRIFTEQSEAGRALRTIQELNYTRRRMTGLRDTLKGVSTGGLEEALSDPATFLRFANEVQRQLTEGVEAKAGSRIKSFVSNALNLPRALMSSFDLSAPLRQGVFLIGRKEFWRALPNMFRYAMSETNYQSMMRDITARNTYPLMVESGLSFSNQVGKLSRREEAFMTDWAGKIPLVGRGVKGSERAYAGFLNKVRADVFDDLVHKFELAGHGVASDPKMLKDLGGFINNATGRGSIGALNSSAPLLSALFFSPRLIMSRLQMLNPAYYMSLSPPVRREAIKSLIAFGGLAVSVMGLAKLGGMDVEADPRSSDFGKLKTGNTRYDILGGFGQYITLGARLATNERVTGTGAVKEYGTKFGQEDRFDALTRFSTNKASPITSLVIEYLRGENAVGEKFDAQDAVTQRFIPMFLQDYNETAQEYGYLEGAGMAAPGLFGVGVQTYTPYGIDPEAEVDAPDSFDMQELDDGSNEWLTARDGTATLTEKAKTEWTRRLNFYTREWMKDEVSDPAWKTMTDQEKADIIADVRNDARRETKKDMIEIMLPQPQEEE